VDGKEFLQRMAMGADEQHRVFREIYPEARRRIKAACSRLKLFDGHKTDDVVQQAMLQMFTKYGAYQGEGSVYTWLWSISKNLVMDLYGQEKRDRTPARPAVGDSRDDEELSPGDEERMGDRLNLEREQCLGAVIDALAAEPPARKGSVRTYDLLDLVAQGWDNAELAIKLGCSVPAVAERKSQAIKKFSELCRRFCGAADCSFA
jgi:RNA polymerase sigma factor (sigma-70 family)